MSTKKKKDDSKERPSKDAHKKGHKSDKSDKEKHEKLQSQSASDIHAHAQKDAKLKKGKEPEKPTTKPKEVLGMSSKSNKELKEHHSSKKFKKSSSAPVFLPKKGGLADTPAVVDDDLYDFLCDPTNCDDGPKLKFKSKSPVGKEPPVAQVKRTGSDKSARSASRQSSSHSFSFS